MRSQCHRFAALVGCLLAWSAPVRSEEPEWKFEWNDTFTLTSPDGDWRLRFGGRLQADWTFATSADDKLQEAVGVLEDGNEVRRGRLYFDGKVYDRVEFKAQYDFAGGDAALKDAYLGFLGTPIGKVRLGHFKEPFSLDDMTSSKNIPFLERSLPSVFAPSRNTGLMVHDSHGDAVNWAIGVFRESDGFGSSSGGGVGVTGRIGWRPIYEDGGRKMLHVGLSASVRDTKDQGDSYRLRQRPDVHLSPRFVDTGGFATDGVELLSLEVAGIHGPFWYSSEYIDSSVDRPGLSSVGFDGFYVQAGYYLTGEHKKFKTSGAAFDRTKPMNSWDRDGGPGAWEVALRFSSLDLSEVATDDGELESVTLGLNWYINPVARMTLNYISAKTDETGGGDFVSIRAQLTF